MKKVMVMTMMLVTFIVNSVFASPAPVSDTLDCNDIHFNVLEQVEDQGYQVRYTGFDSEQFSNDGHLHVVKGIGDVHFVIVGVDETPFCR